MEAIEFLAKYSILYVDKHFVYNNCTVRHSKGLLLAIFCDTSQARAVGVCLSDQGGGCGCGCGCGG